MMDMIVAELTPESQKDERGIPLTDEGQKNFLSLIVTRMAEGETLSSRRFKDGSKILGIAESLGMPFSVVWRWIEDKQERVTAYESALRARADAMVNESIGIVMDTEYKDDVPVAALQAGHLMKVAKSWDRARYGDALMVKNDGATVVSLTFGGPRPAKDVTEESEIIEGDVTEGEPK